MINYIKSIWEGLWTVLVGMRITWLHLFVRNVTIQYPKERFPIPDGTNGTAMARNRLELDMDLCDGCKRCSRACPVNCIELDILQVAKGVEQPILKNGDKRNAWVPSYEIDFAKCCFCGLCTSVCPTDAIKHTTEFEYSSYKRSGTVSYYFDDKKDYDRGLKFSFINLTEAEIEEKKRVLAEFKAQQAAAKAAATVAKPEAQTEAKTE